jgi:hypothetical protein
MQGQLLQKVTMLRRWGRILSGGTAVAVEQGRGRASEPGQLLGYWNDLTGKVSADTLLDSEDVPLSVIAGGERRHFPIAIFQYALGCNDLYLIKGQERHLRALRTCADWAIAHQREDGSWDAFGPIGSTRYTVSSMAQGEGASLLLRASRLLDNASYSKSAKGAIDFMLRPLVEGGTAIYENEELFLEEYPQTSRRSVMNGWIFSLFGLYDMSLADPSYTEVFEISAHTLVNHLSDYDAHYWTYYDIEHRIASPAYHKLHISQLQELGEISGMPEFTAFAEKLEGYQSDGVKRAKALIRKLGQKVTEKSDAVIVQ